MPELTVQDQSAATARKAKRIPRGLLELQLAGDIIMPRCPDPDFRGYFKKYEALFAEFANMSRDQRLLNYKMLTALMLTSHAKKTEDKELKKQLFDQKNQIFINTGNNPLYRKLVSLRYLVSKRPRVLKYCTECEKHNAAGGGPPHARKFCRNCELDRNFYNVLSLHHRFKSGEATIFLSHEHIPKVHGVNLKNKGDLNSSNEEIRFATFKFDVKNLDVFGQEQVSAAVRMLQSR